VLAKLKRVAAFTQSGEGKKIGSNFGYLLVNQAAAFVLPVLLIPYLLHTIGVEAFGQVSLAQTVIGFLVYLSEYGFNISATKQVAQNKEDPEKIQEIFNRVLSTKFFLAGVCLVVLLVLLACVPLYRMEYRLYLFTYFQIIGLVLFPLWLYQGMEDMKLTSLFQTSARVLFFVLTFAVVSKPEHYERVAICYSLGGLLAGIVSYFYACRRYKLFFKWAGFKVVMMELRENMALFLNNFVVIFCLYSAVVFAGFMLDRLWLGYFTTADRILSAIRNLIAVIFLVTHPTVARYAKESHAMLIRFQKVVSIIYLSIVMIASMLLYVLAPFIIGFLTNKGIEEITVLLRIFCLVPFFAALNIPANQVLVTYQNQRGYLGAVTLGAVVNIVLCFWFGNNWAALGLAWAVVLTDVCVTFFNWLFLETGPKEQRLLFHRHAS
jgi:PST family polysaccharide transporter